VAVLAVFSKLANLWISAEQSQNTPIHLGNIRAICAGFVLLVMIKTQYQIGELQQ